MCASRPRPGMSNLVSQSERKESPAGAGSPVYWRVEGSLLELSALRQVAVHLGVERFISNQLEFRDGVATGRLLKPIVRPRGPFAWIASGATDGRLSAPQLHKNLGWKHASSAADATQTATRPDVSIG